MQATETTKFVTTSQKQIVRNYVLQRDGAEKARIKGSGEVHVYGTMPNTNTEGWYFAGWAEDLLQMAAA